MGIKNITLMWCADLYTILIKTMQDFVTPDSDNPGYLAPPHLPYEFMCTHV